MSAGEVEIHLHHFLVTSVLDLAVMNEDNGKLQKEVTLLWTSL